MIGTLRDTLAQQAAALQVSAFDVGALVDEGERRLRRRRVGAVAVAAILAFAVVAGTVLALDPHARRADPVRPPTDRQTSEPAARPARPLVWALEAGFRNGAPAQVHVGARSIDVNDNVHALQATDDGATFLTGRGNLFRTVWFTDGRSVVRLGRTGDAGIRGDDLVKSASAGSLVAWIEYPPAPPAQVVLYDTHRLQEVARTPIGQLPGCTQVWPRRQRPSCLSVLAVRDHIVFVGGRDGSWAGSAARTEPTVRFDMSTGEHRTVSPAEYAEVFRSAARGLVLGDSLESGEPTQGVGELLDVVRGRLVSVRENNHGQDAPAAVIDTATGRSVPSFELPREFRHDNQFIVSQWVDDDRFAVWAHDYMDADTRQGDILVCRLSTARCVLAVPGPPGSRHQLAPEAMTG